MSLLVGVLAARATVAGADPLGFAIPDTLLAALGISLGAGVGSITIKTYKDRTRGDYVAAAVPQPAGAQALSTAAVPAPRVAQMVLVQEGPRADAAVDITKFQNLLFTVFLVGAYVVITVQAFRGKGTSVIRGPADITSLPEFSSTFITLLLISHGAYLAGKLPNRGGSDVIDRALAPDAGKPRYSVVTATSRRAAKPGVRVLWPPVMVVCPRRGSSASSRVITTLDNGLLCAFSLEIGPFWTLVMEACGRRSFPALGFDQPAVEARPAAAI